MRICPTFLLLLCVVPACENTTYLGVNTELPQMGGPGSGGAPQTGGASSMGGAGGANVVPCTLTDSGPITVTEDGTIVENLRITADGETGLLVQANNVTVRNVEVRHQAGPGIVLDAANDVRLESVVVLHTAGPETGGQATDEEENIRATDSANLVVKTARVSRGSSGIVLVNSPDGHLSFIEGHDIRGVSPLGQLVRFRQSDRGRLEDFSVINPPGSVTAHNVHSQLSEDTYIARGHIDGNNAPGGYGVIISGGGIGLVEDVDAIRMGNGCFSTFNGSDGSVFRRTRCRDNICADQGRGAPISGGNMWEGDVAHVNVTVEDSSYWNTCAPDKVAWPATAFSTLELVEEDFEMRPPLNLEFCWE